jgi:hypothetical protein
MDEDDTDTNHSIRWSSRDDASIIQPTNSITEPESHATTRGAAAVGAVTGGVIGLTGGPIGAALGAVGGAIVGAAAERIMHTDDENRSSAEADPGLDSSAASVRTPRSPED